MKAYGHIRGELKTCKFGCCAGKAGKVYGFRDLVDRSRRKRARQEGQKITRQEG